MARITQDEIEQQDESEDERIVQLVTSSAWPADGGEVDVWVNAWEEPWVATAGMRLTEYDAVELVDALREAVRLVAGSEPQGFIRLRLLGDEAPSPTRLATDDYTEPTSDMRTQAEATFVELGGMLMAPGQDELPLPSGAMPVAKPGAE